MFDYLNSIDRHFLSTIIVAIIWFGVPLMYLVSQRNMRPGHGKLKERLIAYADMHDGVASKQREQNSAIALLPSREHKVLLGILKKVEAKNATMVTIWTFIDASIITAVASSKDDAFRQTAILFLFASLPFILAGIYGSRQIDSFSRAFLRTEKTELDLACEMQKELMDDALRKEDALYFSRRGAMLFVVVAITLATIYFYF